MAADKEPGDASPEISEKEKKAAYMKAWRAANREKIAAYNRAYKDEHRDELAEPARERSRQWYAANRARAIAREKVRYREDRAGKIARAAEHKKKRRDADEAAFKAKEAAYRRRKRRESPRQMLDDRMSNLIFYALRREKAGRPWKSLVDYSLDDLIDRLNDTMPAGYSWTDFMSGALHIDHIIPKAVFNYASPEDFDFKRCWALKNLQLLPAEDNLKKGARLTAPFQPSLI